MVLHGNHEHIGSRKLLCTYWDTHTNINTYWQHQIFYTHSDKHTHIYNVILRTVFQAKLLRYSNLFKLGSDRATIWTLLFWLPSSCLMPPKRKTKHLKNIANYIQIKDQILLPLLLTVVLDSATSRFHCHYPSPDQCNISHYTGPLQWMTAAFSTASLTSIHSPYGGHNDPVQCIAYIIHS